MAKIVKDDKSRHDRQKALEIKRQLQERGQKTSASKGQMIPNRKRFKDKAAKRLEVEKAQIEALIKKHRLFTPKTPDEVNTMGMGKNTNTNGQKGTEIEKEKLPHKKAMKASQIKTSQNKGEKANKGKLDTLLGDPKVNTKVYIHKAKEKGQKDKVGINDIGIFEFIFHGLTNLPELEGMDEDRLRELQNMVQEQLHQRDEERERNITKRVQEFKKTFDFEFTPPKRSSNNGQTYKD